MLRNLFRTLTNPPRRGHALFERAVAEARRPLWFEAGEVPDTIDGRFAVLATVCALVIVRIESEGEAGEAVSAALTERFIEAMDAEHRQLGLNDPGLGRRVRKLVGSLARRVADWRQAAAGERDWEECVLSSMYREAPPAPDALKRSSNELRLLWNRLCQSPDQQLAEGQF